jgi:hypothetical protein
LFKKIKKNKFNFPPPPPPPPNHNFVALRSTPTTHLNYLVQNNSCSFTLSKGLMTEIYTVVQEERSIQYFGRWWLSVIVRIKVPMNMCLILNGYTDTAVWIYTYKSTVNSNKQRKITYCYFYFYLMLKWQICYTGMTN